MSDVLDRLQKSASLRRKRLGRLFLLRGHKTGNKQMAMTSKEYREKAGPIAKAMQDMVAAASDEERAFDAEEREKFEAMDAEYTSLKDMADLAYRAETHSAEFQENETEERGALVPAETRELTPAHDPVEAMAGWLNEKRANKVNALQRRSAEMYGYQGNDVVLQFPKSSYKAPATIAEAQRRLDLAYEKRQNSTLTDAAGAYTVDEITMAELEKALLSWGSLRQACTVIRTMNGAPMLLPATDDTGNPGKLLPETQEAAETPLVFSQVPYTSYMFTSDQIPVTYQLLDDTALNLPAEIGELAGIRIGRVMNTYMTTGTGTGQPEGIVTGATNSGVVAASQTQVTWQELINLKHSVDQGYRQSPKQGYMTSDIGLAGMKTMVSETNTPAWQPSLVPNAPDTYDGSPVYVNNDIDAPASATVSYLYGDLGKFVIRDVASYIRFLRLDEVKATSAMVVFLAFMRSDSRIRQPAAIKYLTMAT